MTKQQLAELVLRRLEGGDYADSQYTEQEVYYYLETVINKMFKVQAAEMEATGVNLPHSTMLGKFNVSGTLANESTGAWSSDYVEFQLPMAPVALPNNMGLFKVYPRFFGSGGSFREFVPVPVGQANLHQGSVMNTAFLNSIDHYVWEGGRTVYARYKDGTVVSDVNLTVVMVVNPLTSVADDTELYFSADIVNDIIMGAVQMLTGQPEDDSSTNFNNKPNK